jgi:hypothetical protein
MQTDSFYCIPLTKEHLQTTMDLLTHHKKDEIVSSIRNFINEEYKIDYVPHCEDQDESN